jgi:hypothetical protein
MLTGQRVIAISQGNTMSVQEPDLPSLAGHLIANAQPSAVKHVELTLICQRAPFLLVVDASTEHITGDVVHARIAVVVSCCSDRPRIRLSTNWHCSQNHSDFF